MALKLTALSVIGALAVTGAQAATVDFTADPLPTEVIGIGVGVTGSQPITRTPFDGPAGSTGGLAEVIDGLGVEPEDEIFGQESITVTFLSDLFVTGLAFLDLFASQDGQTREVAGVSFFLDGALVDTKAFDATEVFAPGGAGFLRVTFARVLADELVFSAIGNNDGFGDDDFAVAAIDVAPIPLPAAGWMFVSALAGMGLLSRSRRSA